MKAIIWLTIFISGVTIALLLLSAEHLPMPTSYEESYNLSAIMALIVGGAWAVTTWVHQERLRKARDIPGIEMEIRFSEKPMEKGNVLLTVDVEVKNTSNVAIFPKVQEVTLAIERLESPQSAGFLPTPPGKDEEIKFPASNLSELCLEPHTRTVFSEFFVAESGALYSTFFRMPSEFRTSDGHDWFWGKRRVHYVSPNNK